VLGGGGAADRQQALLGVWRRHPREGTDLGVRELAVGERLSKPRQRGQCSRATRTFSRAEPRSRPTRQESHPA
jgi:hypothetical protein